MPLLTRYLIWFSTLALSVPIVAYLVIAWNPAYSAPFSAFVLFLCPASAFFAATAACAPFDACSLHMLAVVVGANILMYGLLAVLLWITRSRTKSVRFAILLSYAVASVWWVRQWVA